MAREPQVKHEEPASPLIGMSKVPWSTFLAPSGAVSVAYGSRTVTVSSVALRTLYA